MDFPASPESTVILVACTCKITRLEGTAFKSMKLLPRLLNTVSFSSTGYFHKCWNPSNMDARSRHGQQVPVGFELVMMAHLANDACLSGTVPLPPTIALYVYGCNFWPERIKRDDRATIVKSITSTIAIWAKLQVEVSLWHLGNACWANWCNCM